MIVGIDEVGRGCWAGPLVACAVVLSSSIKGLDDSKKLSKKQRENLDAEIRLNAEAIGLGWVEPKEIDELGLSSSVKLAMSRALEQVEVKYSKIIIDGNINYLNEYSNSQAIVKADSTVKEVSAASIVAKVARDKYMRDISIKFPGYHFEKHVGYGTKLHRDSIGSLGICELHRLSYKPLAKFRTA